MEPKITLKQLKELTKLEGEIGVHLEELTNELKVVQKAHNKRTKILQTVRETTGLTSFD